MLDLTNSSNSTLQFETLLSPLAPSLYSCLVADGRPLKAVAELLPGPEAGSSVDKHRRHWLASPAVEALTWSEVAIGMMVGLRGVGHTPPNPQRPIHGRAELEARLRLAERRIETRLQRLQRPGELVMESSEGN